MLVLFFFFNDTATTEIYTLSLHDALPISHLFRSCRDSCSSRCGQGARGAGGGWSGGGGLVRWGRRHAVPRDRKSTRLNSSHANISYAVFCLKKKKRGGKGQSAVT